MIILQLSKNITQCSMNAVKIKSLSSIAVYNVYLKINVN
jgi:hypothetical protein